MPTDRTLDVWVNSISRPMPCNGPTCRDRIIWATVVGTGRKMCFTHPTEPVATQMVPDPRNRNVMRQIAQMPFERNHWHTCPDRDKFRRPKSKE